MEALARIRIPGEARQILDVILRKTYGWNKCEDVISLSQFVEMTVLSKTHVCRGVNKLLSINIITKKGNAISRFTHKGNDYDVSYGLQKDFENWHTLPKKGTLPIKVIDVTHKGNTTLPIKGHTKETIKTIKDKTKIYTPIFKKWNEQEIIKHGQLNPKTQAAIKNALTEYSETEILQAIENYSAVFFSEKHFFTYRWTLLDFLNRGLRKFVMGADPLNNFLTEKEAPFVDLYANST